MYNSEFSRWSDSGKKREEKRERKGKRKRWTHRGRERGDKERSL